MKSLIGTIERNIPAEPPEMMFTKGCFMDIPDSMHAPYDLRYEAVTMDTHINYQRNEDDQGAFSFTHIRQSRLLNSLKSKIKYKK